MALVVETGSGAASSEVCASVAAYKAYCDARGISYSALSDAQIEQRLRLGWDYLTATYRDAWAGQRVSTTQGVDFPRDLMPMRDGPGTGISVSYYPNNTVPAVVVSANIEAATRAGSPLIPDEGQAVASKTVGPVSITYQDYSRATKTYRAIDRLLAPVLKAGGGLRIVRA